MTSIDNAFTKLLGIRVPVVGAPMANVARADLAVQVTLGGGFGFIGAGYNSPQALIDDLAESRETLTAVGRYRAGERLPIGVGYLAWKLDQDETAARKMLDAALDAGVQAIWLSFGASLGRWVEYVRARDSAGSKTLVFILVNSVEEALAAVNELRADVLVAQGIEAGGHGGSYAPPVFSLVSSILDTLPRPLPVLAAGGLSNGRQIAAFLTLGASGAVLGTRFLLTPESLYSPAQKAALLAASATDTVRTLAFDEARDTLGWPRGVDGRGLNNALVRDREAHGVDVATLRARFAQHAGHDADYAVVWAGTGVGSMREIKGAQDIVHELHGEILARLQASQGLLGVSGAREKL